MIIFEGPDGGGKSTAARAVSEALNIPVADRVVSAQAKAMVDLKKWTDDNLAAGFQDVIFDRHRLISAPIYDAVLGRVHEDLYDPAWLGGTMMRFYQLKPIIIYCLPDLETVRYNVEHGPDDNSAVDQKIEHIYQQYVTRASIDSVLYSTFTTIFDYTLYPNSPHRIINRVRRLLDLRKSRIHA